MPRETSVAAKLRALSTKLAEPARIGAQTCFGAQESADGPPKSLTGKTCYKDNEWLKGSNGIFEGIFGGPAVPREKLRPPSGPGIGGNFNRRIGQMG